MDKNYALQHSQDFPQICDRIEWKPSYRNEHILYIYNMSSSSDTP